MNNIDVAVAEPKASRDSKDVLPPLHIVPKDENGELLSIAMCGADVGKVIQKNFNPFTTNVCKKCRLAYARWMSS